MEFYNVLPEAIVDPNWDPHGVIYLVLMNKHTNRFDAYTNAVFARYPTVQNEVMHLLDLAWNENKMNELTDTLHTIRPDNNRPYITIAYQFSMHIDKNKRPYANPDAIYKAIANMSKKYNLERDKVFFFVSHIPVGLFNKLDGLPNLYPMGDTEDIAANIDKIKLNNPNAKVELKYGNES